MNIATTFQRSICAQCRLSISKSTSPVPNRRSSGAKCIASQLCLISQIATALRAADWPMKAEASSGIARGFQLSLDSRNSRAHSSMHRGFKGLDNDSRLLHCRHFASDAPRMLKSPPVRATGEGRYRSAPRLLHSGYGLFAKYLGVDRLGISF
jgi:hypothetical protein